MSLLEILITLEKITGLKAPSIKMPFWVALGAGWVCELISNHLTGKPPAVPLAGVKMAKYFMYFDSSKAIKKLGLPQKPVEHALRQSVDWFKKNNYVAR
jgi:dihydroflavonol-4-reductase